MRDLSILIPARNEMFLGRTVEDLLANIEGNTEIIVALDGEWPEEPLPEDERITVIHFPKSIGQRAATNQACRLSSAKYVMKVDAHCAFDKGFDVKMIADMRDDWTMVPTMYNLHAFNWFCVKCGHQWYQGPTPTRCLMEDGKTERANCNGNTFRREMVWKPRLSRISTAYRFDKTMHFQYWGAFKDRPEAQGDISPTLSLQGSCFMLTREKYWELDICDEKHGSWGQQGTEVACKTWLSGGQVMVNKKTWYSHMFRTQGGDFGFPYKHEGGAVEAAREYSRKLWLGNSWPKAIHTLEWLIQKFGPVPGWGDGPSKGIVYYTDNRIGKKLMEAVQARLAATELPIVSVSLAPLEFGDNITLDMERGYLAMFKQILAGLERIQTDVVFLCEHDVLYHPSHFAFTPPDRSIYYYNTNVWKTDGKRAFRVDDCRQTSGLCAYRETLLKHYRERVRRVEAEGFNRNMGFEPGTHGRKERVDDLKSERWESEFPNVDVRHGANLTKTRWSPSEFRDQRYTKGWVESQEIPGWGDVEMFAFPG